MLTQDRLKEMFFYDEESGRLFWRERPRRHFATGVGHKRFNTMFSGKEFGRIVPNPTNSYRHGTIAGRGYIAHRLIFLYCHGFLPEQVDHIDGNGLNNRLDNLRAATHTENMRNRPVPRDNNSGVTGVRFSKHHGKWLARIGFDRRHIHLGCFDTKSQAAAARKEAERRYGFHENHGRPPLEKMESTHV